MNIPAIKYIPTQTLLEKKTSNLLPKTYHSATASVKHQPVFHIKKLNSTHTPLK